jgi:hypothetical protein
MGVNLFRLGLANGVVLAFSLTDKCTKKKVMSLVLGLMLLASSAKAFSIFPDFTAIEKEKNARLELISVTINAKYRKESQSTIPGVVKREMHC